MSALKNRGSQQIVGLDCLRFLAAMLVVMFHLSYWSWRSPTSDTGVAMAGVAAFPTLGPWFSGGWVGVQIFFVISGFVISYTADSKSAFDFLRSRILRLYPAVWVCATITLSFVLATNIYPTGIAGLYYLKSLALFPLGPWIDGVYWSLRVELSFYALILILLLFDKFRYFETIMEIVGSVSSVFCVTALTYTGGHQWPLFSSYGELLLLSHGSAFALGVTIWLSTKTTLTARRIRFCCIYCVGIVAILTTRDGAVNAMLLFATSLCWIVLSIRYNANLCRTIGSGGQQFLRTVGLITYPVYLLHDLSGAVLMRWLVIAGLTDTAALLATIACIIGISGAIVSIAEPQLRKPLDVLLGACLRRCRPSIRQRLQQGTASAVAA